MNIKLVISEANREVVKLLLQGLEECPEITVLQQKPNQLLKHGGLDAIYLTVTAAERFGARPIAHKAQVLRTAPADTEKGWPPYIIAGGVFDLDDPNEPRFQLTVIITSVLEAVKAFNLAHNVEIRSIGFWGEDLLIREIDPIEAGQVVRSAYKKSCGD